MPLGAVNPRKSGPPEAVQDGGCRRRRLLAQRRACCPGLPRGLVRVPATRAPPSAAPAPRAIELAVGRPLNRGLTRPRRQLRHAMQGRDF